MGMTDSSFRVLVDCLNYSETNMELNFRTNRLSHIGDINDESICILSIINICGKETEAFLHI